MATSIFQLPGFCNSFKTVVVVVAATDMSECIPTHRVAFVRLMGNFFWCDCKLSFKNME